ncbi:hypothetical protein H6501_04305 [Candidatus Woesearchaeota archaeon]|nr:hypothetical protein [Nanoarchaeota archaeon]MCB9370795.1 hypothetical protein [Candidatus Woesearchaeota archaeon]USN44962.1 MAG: hypothetical protein H6500_05905 [Candidatus Woesearchaeota archaeon]
MIFIFSKCVKMAFFYIENSKIKWTQRFRITIKG